MAISIKKLTEPSNKCKCWFTIFSMLKMDKIKEQYYKDSACSLESASIHIFFHLRVTI